MYIIYYHIYYNILYYIIYYVIYYNILYRLATQVWQVTIYYITVSPPRRHQVVTKSSPRPFRVPTVSITHITGQNV